jgi:uncharacterized lipoprotein YajG
MTLICIIAKLLTIKIKHMKKLLIILGFFLLTGCGASNYVATNIDECPIDQKCNIIATHYHVY